MNRNTSDLKIALLRSSLSLQPMEFSDYGNLGGPFDPKPSLFFAKLDFGDPYGSHQKLRA
jgi:hypothetical protein